MPIFGRRQLQRMLNELGPRLARGKAKDLLNRLKNEKPNQALPAEYELSISWAVSKIATLNIDRPAGSRTPDIYSPDLLTGGPVIADVAAVDDLTLSGADTKRRACNIINGEADRLLGGSSEHLYYSFREKSGYERSRNGKSAFYRRRKRGFPEVSLDETLDDGEEDGPKKDFGCEDGNLAGSVDRLVLERAIAGLPPGYRVVFVLHDIEGYEHNEVAEMLGCSIGNSKSQLHKARLKLRGVLNITRAEKGRHKQGKKQRDGTISTSRKEGAAVTSAHCGPDVEKGILSKILSLLNTAGHA